ncbi:MAG: hypothetical protein QGF59_10725 [Pirellulaceae bacterium]|jgi:hypothetical protein|nr:hypothetical protein [Pirellulaceae bacterium]MDP6719115.1 hypothetical protein [Pirellulaceae bacterium]
MPSERDKTKRWRPKFSVRTLVVLVTLICAYLACWAATRTRGVDDVSMHVNLEDLANFGTPEEGPLDAVRRAEVWMVTAKVPFLVGAIEWDSMYSGGRYLMATSGRRVYYLWFFGYVAKLPYSHRT